MKQLLLLAVMPALLLLSSACSDRQTKSNTKSTKNTNDRSASLNFERSIAFATASGDTLTSIRAAVADEIPERNAGLMNVRTLAEDRGMLFVFESQRELSFWMANTPLSLDIMFVNKAHKIVRIHHNTPPYSEQSFTSGKPAQYAIETNAGFAVSHDIQEGMQALF